MREKLLPYLLIFVLSSCSYDQKKLDGTWLLEFADTTLQFGGQILRIKNDTAKILFCPWLISESERLNLTKDSISLPTQCFDYRVGYKIENEILYFENQFIARKIQEPSLKSIIGQENLILNLKSSELKSTKLDGKSINSAIFIGRQKAQKFPVYFNNNFSLIINDIFIDSTEMVSWVKSIEDYEQPQSVVLYRDSSFADQQLFGFIDKLKVLTGGKVNFYEGFYSQSAEYYLEFKRL